MLRTTAEERNADFPLALTTVRVRDAWHGGTRTGTVAALDLPPVAVQVAPSTLAALGVADDELVRLETARGSVVLPVAASDTVAPDLLVLPMHYGSLWLPSSAGVNLLTIAAIDPLSKQPELKHAAARLVRDDPGFPWHGALLARLTDDRVGEALEHLRALAARAAFGSVSLFARDAASPGVLLQLAHRESMAPDLHALAARLGMAADAARLADVRAGRVRALQFAGGRVTVALLEGRSRADLAARCVYRRLIADAVDCSQHSMRDLYAPAT